MNFSPPPHPKLNKNKRFDSQIDFDVTTEIDDLVLHLSLGKNKFQVLNGVMHLKILCYFKVDCVFMM